MKNVFSKNGHLLFKNSKAPHPSASQTPILLRYPKYSAAFAPEYFDRGAKPCLLHRPQDALRKLCPKGRLIKSLTHFPARR